MSDGTVAQRAPWDQVESFGRSAQRTADFWGRATRIYASYKTTQLRALALRTLGGKTEDEVKAELWVGQHEYAGDQMYELAVSLRGFYLKVPAGDRRGN